MTKQVEYRGEMVELTEALTHLPAGGQVVLSDTTYQRAKGRLLEVQLPAFTFTCARNSLEAITNRSLSKMIEQVVMKQMHARLCMCGLCLVWKCTTDHTIQSTQSAQHCKSRAGMCKSPVDSSCVVTRMWHTLNSTNSRTSVNATPLHAQTLTQ